MTRAVVEFDRPSRLVREPRNAIRYGRVSDDNSGDRSPVEQVESMTHDIARNGDNDYATVLDVDASASRWATKPRVGWAEVLRMIRALGVEGRPSLYLWEISRLTRTMREFVDFTDLCIEVDARIVWGGREYDLADPDDLYFIEQQVSLGQRESGVTRKRVKRAITTNVTKGTPHGRRHYGYRHAYDPDTGALVGQVEDEAEGKVVREMARRVLAGESFSAIVKWTDAEGYTTATGCPWSPNHIRRLLLSPTLRGHRTHRGEIVVENAWPEIIDEPTFYALRDRLTVKPRRATAGAPRVASTRYLLGGGLIVCDVCKRPIYGSTNKNRAAYRCDAGHVARLADRLDAAVVLLVCEWLADPQRREALTGTRVEITASHAADLKAKEARLDDLSAKWDADLIADEDYGRKAKLLRAQIADLKALVDDESAVRAVAMPLAQLLEADDVAARWHSLDDADRRHVVEALIVDAALLTRGKGRGRPKAGEPIGLRFMWAGSVEVTL